MTLKTFVTGALLSTALAIPASAQTSSQASAQTGSDGTVPQNSAELLDLVRGCENDSCLSYVTGAVHGIAVWSIWSKAPMPFCTGDNVSNPQIRDAIVSTIETTPGIEDQHPVISILTAFGRYWPCMSDEQVAALDDTHVGKVAGEVLAELDSGRGRMLTLGNPDATPARTLRVFHDANCPHCRSFQDTSDELAKRGWKVEIFPVVTAREESAGFGAVEIALREISPEAVDALYRHQPEGVADISMASNIARQAGVSEGDLLLAVARSGAYASVEQNTRLFYEIGATGTPSWMVGDDLFQGHLTANTLEYLIREREAATSAPSPDEPHSSAAKEQK